MNSWSLTDPVRAETFVLSFLTYETISVTVLNSHVHAFSDSVTQFKRSEHRHQVYSNFCHFNEFQHYGCSLAECVRLIAINFFNRD